MNEQHQREEAIFDAAFLLSPDARGAYLNEACAGDQQLRQRVESLLKSHEKTSGVLEDAVGNKTIRLSVPPSEKPGDKIDRYKLLQQIGEGGCGVVYMAEQEEPVRRRVALKIIKLGMDTKQVIARFEAERQALAMMDHPNIAKVLDAGATETGRPYFVMELVRGVRITDYCDEHKIATEERLKLFLQVCQAIQHAHQKGVIHRDIKPSNVLVTINDGVPVPKVIDFGIAKSTQGRLTDQTLFTAFEQFIGTPAYMSPEQAVMTSLDIDTRSDIYSLGVLLYELLTGRTPFDQKELLAAGLDEMRRTIREKEPPRPSTCLSTMAADALTTTANHRHTDVPKLIHLLRGDLDWIVMKALDKDRTRRYETANGLAMDIQRHLSNEPVVARPASTAYRFQKAFRRNKLAFGAGMAVVLALVVGLGLAAMGWRETSIERDKARQAQQATETARKGEETQRREAQSAQEVATVQARKALDSQEQSRRLLYASDMNLAQQALKLNNLGRVRRLLDRHRPQHGEEDLRGWEWRYLWQLTRSSALVTLTNRPTRGYSVSFSPDGTRLAVGWFDGRVDLWDVPGRQLVRALTDRGDPYLAGYTAHVTFSPVRSLLAATSEPKVVTLYDLDSGLESLLWRAPDQGKWDVRDLSFSKDGSQLVIYGGNGETNDAVWVVNVFSSKVESCHSTLYTRSQHLGAARLSPDNRRLFLPRSECNVNRYSIRCIDLATGKELWQTEPQRDFGLTALAVSPDGRVLVSGSGYEDPRIRIWDAANGHLITQLDGHAGWVCKLAFTKDGEHLISSATDQTIRFWDTRTWTESQVLRGHTDEINALAISEPAGLVASASKDGDLLLWKADANATANGYRRLPESLFDQFLLLDGARLLSLPAGKPPELFDLKRDSAPVSLAAIGFSTNFLGGNIVGEFGVNVFCYWNATNEILVRELRGLEAVQIAAVSLDSHTRPVAATYGVRHQLLAWIESASATSIHLASLTTPDHRTELRSDVPELVVLSFSEDDNYLGAVTASGDSLRIWNVNTGQRVASVNGFIRDAKVAAGGQVLVVATARGDEHEIGFYDLIHPDRLPTLVSGRYLPRSLAVSPDGGLVALSTEGGMVRLFDPAKGEWLEDLHGHLNAAFGVAFSRDGRRLISSGNGREALKLWDVSTRQELLTLEGTGGPFGVARWSADGDVILAGPLWQSWRAPSWEKIAAAEIGVKKSN